MIVVIDFEPPSQTITLLFADLASSTHLWEQFPEAMKTAMERHDAILRAAVEGSHGHVVKTTGDGLMAVFASALDGVNACLKAQQNLLEEPWGETGPLRVRMGLHVGEAQPRSGDYYGPAVNRAARLMSAAHGGQVLLSSVAASMVVDLLPAGTTLRDLGEHRLKDLTRSEHIFQLLHPGLAADFPPLVSLDHRPNNLQTQPTPLIGREKELSEVIKRLNTEGMRLLTLTGPGGIGKTRLALQAAADLVDRFVDGVYFVDLAPIRDPEAALAAIAQTLGLRETSDRHPLDELKSQLHAKSMLLLLDNFEQVTAAASQVGELLRNCPQLKLLVTSREALHIRGEFVFPVPPLALPRVDTRLLQIDQLTEYEAVRLFIDRAQAVKPDFEVTNENAPAVAEICVRLEGLPLAIELAAARIRLFTPQALLDRLGTRLKLLRGGARDLPLRQQTLWDAIDWSYDLLETGEKRLFELLSVFVGGCSFEAVEALSNRIEPLHEMGVDVLDRLSSLVEKSLIRQMDRSGDQTSSEPRLLMLETIREYAAERLEADESFFAKARLAHAAYFADYTEHQSALLKDTQREAALEDLVSEIENVRTAWGYWVKEQDLDQLNKFIGSLWLLYDRKGWYHATIDLTTDMLNVLSATPLTPERVEQEIVLQTSLARVMLTVKGYTAEVEQAYKRALELSQAVGDIPQLLPVLRGLASLYGYVNQYDKAVQMGERILSLGKRLDNASIQLEGRLILGYTHAFMGDFDRGLSYLNRVIADYDPNMRGAGDFRIGNDPGVVCLSVTALFLWMQGFPDRALERADGAVSLARRLDHPYSLAYALFHNSLLHLWRREYLPVQERAREALSIAEEYKFYVWQAVATCLHGAALAGLEQPEEGLRQVIQGIELYQGLNTPPTFWPMLLQIQAEVYGQVGKPERGLAVIDKSLEIIGAQSEEIIAPEFYRLKSHLLLTISPDYVPEAKEWLYRALKVTQKFPLSMLELRIAISLCRLPGEQNPQLLSNVYKRFTEGFNTPDLIEARELLATLQ